MVSKPSPGDGHLRPDEAFALLGNEVRVGILQVLWDAFESGTGDNAVPYSTLFDRVDYDDSGNFSYHLQKLAGPFVHKTDDGYELKQSGINILRAIAAGTVVDDPTFGPERIDESCPRCGAPVAFDYADELVTVTCTACEGALRWNGDHGFLFLGLVPPVFVSDRSTEEAFHAAITYTSHEIAAFTDGVCPHCASTVERTVDVCPEHDPGRKTLCRTCDRSHMAEVWMVCSTCKRSMFPPVRAVVLTHPEVTAFYHECGVEHRFASWAAAVRSFTVTEERLSMDPPRVRCTFSAGTNRLHLTVDEKMRVLEVTR